MNTAIETASSVAHTVAAKVERFVPATVKEKVIQLQERVKEHGLPTVSEASLFAHKMLSAYTPSHVMRFIEFTLSTAHSVRIMDPVKALRPYVPAYVIHTSERTYEFVTENIEQTKETVTSHVTATTGYLVSKVNGTVEFIASIPQIHSVIAQLNVLAEPVLVRLRSFSNSVDVQTDEIAPAAQ